MTLSNKRTLCRDASKLIEATKASGTFTRHTIPGHSHYNVYTSKEATVYEFLKDDYMLPTLVEGELEIQQGSVRRFVRWEDDTLEEDENGNVLEVIKGPASVLVTEPWSNDRYFSESINKDSIKEQMANESCCLIEDALSDAFIDMINGLPTSTRVIGPADIRCHREFSLHFLHKNAIRECLERITGLDLEEINVMGREMQAGSYEILNDTSGMQDTLYVISTMCMSDSLQVSGGMTRFLATDGEELVNYSPRHNTTFMVYASSREPIRVYTELIKQCSAPFRQVIFRCTTK